MFSTTPTMSIQLVNIVPEPQCLLYEGTNLYSTCL